MKARDLGEILSAMPEDTIVVMEVEGIWTRGTHYSIDEVTLNQHEAVILKSKEK